jgi:hypothetical protein
MSSKGKTCEYYKCGKQATFMIKDPRGRLTLHGYDHYRCTEHAAKFSLDLDLHKFGRSLYLKGFAS